MNCEFCQHELFFSHLENHKEVEVYDCKGCPVLVSFSFFVEGKTRIKTSFFIDRGEKLYIWSNNYLNNVSYISEVTVKEAKGPQDSGPFHIKFPKIMNIDPDNVKEKLAFFLVFS